MASIIHSKKIFELISKAGMTISKAAEIGVYNFETSAIKPLIEHGIKCDLYEAIPTYCEEIEKAIASFQHTKLVNCAVADYNGEMTLYLAGPSTFNATQRESPAINHDKLDVTKATPIIVQCRDFQDLDIGDYDYVSVDVEGGEFNILKRMTSRPAVINLETQSRDYVNPRLGSITDWMVENDYKIWFRNDTDTLFIKSPRKSAGFLLDINARRHNLKYFAGRL